MTGVDVSSDLNLRLKKLRGQAQALEEYTGTLPPAQVQEIVAEIEVLRSKPCVCPECGVGLLYREGGLWKGQGKAPEAAPGRLSALEKLLEQNNRQVALQTILVDGSGGLVLATAVDKEIQHIEAINALTHDSLLKSLNDELGRAPPLDGRNGPPPTFSQDLYDQTMAGLGLLRQRVEKFNRATATLARRAGAPTDIPDDLPERRKRYEALKADTLLKSLVQYSEPLDWTYPYPPDPPTLKARIGAYAQALAVGKRDQERRDALEARIKDLQTQIWGLEGGPEGGNLERCIQKRDRYRDDLDAHAEWVKGWASWTRFRQMEVDLLDTQNSYEALKARVSLLGQLSAAVKEAETRSIDEFVGSLNLHAASYFESFFPDQDLSVVLVAGAAGLNFVVNYGILSDCDISVLSGGERDRVSLAYNLALSELTGSRLLLLDECVSSLDSVACQNVIDCLKERYHGLVLCVCHQVVTGSFDQVVDI